MTGRELNLYRVRAVGSLNAGVEALEVVGVPRYARKSGSCSRGGDSSTNEELDAGLSRRYEMSQSSDAAAYMAAHVAAHEASHGAADDAATEDERDAAEKAGRETGDEGAKDGGAEQAKDSAAERVTEGANERATEDEDDRTMEGVDGRDEAAKEDERAGGWYAAGGARIDSWADVVGPTADAEDDSDDEEADAEAVVVW